MTAQSLRRRNLVARYTGPSAIGSIPQAPSHGPVLNSHQQRVPVPGSSGSVPQTPTSFPPSVPSGTVGTPQQKTHGPPIKPPEPGIPKGAPKGPTPLPIDPVYQQQIDQIRHGLSGTESDLLYQQQQAQQAYGIDDASNPYSRAALLAKSYQQSQQGAATSYAAGGQYLSGAYQRAQDRILSSNMQAGDALRRDYSGLLDSIRRKHTTAEYTAQDAERAAFNARVARALANRPDDVPAPYKAPKKVKPQPVGVSKSVPQQKTHSKGKTTKTKFYRQYGTKGLTPAGWKQDARWLLDHGYHVPKRYWPKGYKPRREPGSSGSVPQPQIPPHRRRPKGG